MKHEIECDVLQLRLMAERVLQKLEMRNAVFADRYQLAIDNGIALHAFERFRNFDVAVAHDLAVAAVKRDAAVFDLCDHPEAVILILEYPAFCRRTGHP
jgi:hypothetical protein